VLVELALALVVPLGLDLSMPGPEDNPLTADKIELGRRLFFDRRLSADGSVSCATCHQPGPGCADDRPVAVGVFGRSGRRNSPDQPRLWPRVLVRPPLAESRSRCSNPFWP
jgi:cytochrome c peroxidase